MSNLPTEQNLTDSNGWNYSRNPPPDGDCRKLVWLEKDDMGWIGLRAWDGKRWLNGGEPEQASVLCWQDLPGRPWRHWEHGKLVPEPSEFVRRVRESRS